MARVVVFLDDTNLSEKKKPLKHLHNLLIINIIITISIIEMYLVIDTKKKWVNLIFCLSVPMSVHYYEKT